jgi:hemolysin-activating ACP:hemolysin acyltransferase
MNDIEYLIDTYYNKETWHKTKLPKDTARKYFTKGLENGNIVILKEEEPIGYLSVWFLDNEQAARVINRKPFHAADENITDGEIVYVANAYIEEEHRGKGNIRKLKEAMKQLHSDREYVGIIYRDSTNEKFSFYKKGEI